MNTPVHKYLFALIVLFMTISGRSGNSDTDSNTVTDSELEQANDLSVTNGCTTETIPAKIETAPLEDTTIVCLSPGHPSTKGDKYYEAILNRKVAWFLAVFLLEANYKVVFAVEDVPPDSLFFSNLNNDDETLWSRLSVMTPEEKANRCNVEGADYLISIHHNYAYSDEINQTMVFYTQDENYRPLHKEAMTWAELTADYLGKVMKTDDAYAIADLERIGFPLGILSNADMPGILTEASFYSNPNERSRLNDDWYLSQEAEAIFNAFTAQFQ